MFTTYLDKDLIDLFAKKKRNRFNFIYKERIYEVDFLFLKKDILSPYKKEEILSVLIKK